MTSQTTQDNDPWGRGESESPPVASASSDPTWRRAIAWLAANPTAPLTLTVTCLLWLVLAVIAYWFLCASSDWVIVKDFDVASDSVQGVDGRGVAAQIVAELRRVTALHTEAPPLDAMRTLAALVRQHDSETDQLLERPSRELKGIAAISLAAGNIRALELGLGHVKVGDVSLPIELVGVTASELTGRGPTVIAGTLAKGARDMLRLTVEMRQPGQAHLPIVLAVDQSKGVENLVEEVAIQLVWQRWAKDRGVPFGWFRHVTQGLQDLKTFETALSARSLHNAARSFELAIVADPTRALAYYNRGLVAELLGSYALARSYMETAIARQADLHIGRLRLALLLAREGDLDRAIELTQQVRAATGDHIGRVAEVYLAKLFRASERLNDEVTTWSAIRSWADASLAEALTAQVTGTEQAVAEIEKASANQVGAMQLFSLANILEKHRLYGRASDTYSQIISDTTATRPVTMCAQLRRGRARALDGRYKDSQADYEAIVSSSSAGTTAMQPPCQADESALFVDYWLGRNYLALDRAKDAHDAFRRHVKRYPQLLSGYFDLATALLQLSDDPVSALREYAQLEQVQKAELSRGRKGQPKIYALARENMARLHSYAGDHCRAAAIMKDVVLEPASPAVRARRYGQFAQYLVVGPRQADAALNAAATALALNSGDAGAYNALAMVALDRGQFAKASPLLRRAWEYGQEEDRATTLWLGGELALRQDQPEEARDLLNWSLALYGKDLAPHYLLILADRDSGRLEQVQDTAAVAIRRAKSGPQRDMFVHLRVPGRLKRVGIDHRRAVQCPRCACTEMKYSTR